MNCDSDSVIQYTHYSSFLKQTPLAHFMFCPLGVTHAKRWFILFSSFFSPHSLSSSSPLYLECSSFRYLHSQLPYFLQVFLKPYLQFHLLNEAFPEHLNTENRPPRILHPTSILFHSIWNHLTHNVFYLLIMITVCLSPRSLRTRIFVLFTNRSQVPRTVLNTLWAINKS